MNHHYNRFPLKSQQEAPEINLRPEEIFTFKNSNNGAKAQEIYNYIIINILRIILSVGGRSVEEFK